MMKCLHGLKPALTMVAVQFGYGGVTVMYKIAASDGMKLKVMIAYRFIFASALMFPLAFFMERKSRPKLTWMILFQSFLCGLFGGSLAQWFYVGCLTLASATLASAMTNLIPAITFILAVSFRLEKLNFGDIRGKAKLLGSLLGIGGAAILTLYKGVEINIWSTQVDFLSHGQHHQQDHLQAHSTHTYVSGCLLGVGCCVSLSLWLIIQAKMSEKYPCQYSSTALMSIMSAIQMLVFALSTETDWSQWKLGWNIRLLAVAFAGIVGSGLVVTLIAWCVRMRGPVYVSVFNPLLMVIVAIAGSLVLKEKLHLGSLLAAVLMVIGLYLVLWGKAKEIMKKKNSQLSQENQSQPNELVHIVVTASSDNAVNLNKLNNAVNDSKITPNPSVENDDCTQERQ